jgi:hypothetical protein
MQLNGLGTFNNHGTFLNTDGAATASNVTFNNDGLVDIQSGTIGLSSYTQTAGETRLSGGSISTSTALDIQGGTVTGSGTVSGYVVSSGETSPGFSPGEITVNGTYDQRTVGALSIEIGGLSDGSAAGTVREFDQLDVDGAVILAGALNVILIDDDQGNIFAPVFGNQFTIIKNDDPIDGPLDPVVGTFNGLLEGDIVDADGYYFEISYEGGTGNDVVLTAVNRPPIVDDQSFDVVENGTTVGVVAASDPDLPNDTLTYSISGGPDAGRFTVNSATGELTFLSAPDFETPSDDGGDNV